jgi:PAS domain S-box-containing protein
MTLKQIRESRLPVGAITFRRLVECSSDLHLVFDHTGTITYANPAALTVLGIPCEALTGRSIFDSVDPSDTASLQAQFHQLAGAGSSPVRLDFRVRHADGTWRALAATAMNLGTDEGKGGTAVICRDITEQKRAQRRIRALNRLSGVLSDVNHAIVRGRDRAALLDAACHIAVETGGFRMVWIGLLNPDGRVDPVAHAGLAGGYPSGLTIDLENPSRGHGLAALAFRSGESVVCNDIDRDERMAAARQQALDAGLRSLAVFPLSMFGSVAGIICLYSTDVQFFDDDEVKLLRELASDLSLALEFFEQDKQRTLAQESVRQSEERYRSLFDCNPHPMWVYDIETLRFLAVNDAAVEKYGYSKSQFLEMTIADIRPPQDIPALLGSIATIPTGVQHAGTWRHRTAEGRTISVEITSHEIQFAGRRADLVLAIDVTEKRRVERAIRENEGWLRALFEQAAVGVAQLETGTGRFVRVNQKYCDIVGYTREEMQTIDFRTIVHPEDRQHALNALDQLQSGDVLEATSETRFVRSDGDTVWVSLTASAVWSPEEPTISYATVVQDITSRKQTESELAQVSEHLHQAQKLESLGRLAGGIAHDLNNVLMPIIGYTQLLLTELPPKSQAHDDLSEVNRAAERASALVRQILAFSRKQVLQLADLDVNDVIHHFMTMLKRLIGEHIELHVVLEPELPPVRADRGQLEQVIMNLAVNARDAMPRGGRLTIATAAAMVDPDDPSIPPGTPAGACVKLTVEDNGQGMDPQTREHVFEPFFTTKPMGRGTGLGLATVFGIVKQHDGNITVDSRLEHGTLFTIWLPAGKAGPPVTHEAPMRSEPQQAERATVLVVEDDASVRRFVTFALKTHGFVVLEAPHAAAALKISDEVDRIDLLLTDVVMPEMNGHELYKRMVLLRPAIRVLFMSGYTDDVIADQGLHDAGITLLQKPFAVETLLTRVRQALAGPSDKE